MSFEFFTKLDTFTQLYIIYSFFAAYLSYVMIKEDDKEKGNSKLTWGGKIYVLSMFIPIWNIFIGMFSAFGGCLVLTDKIKDFSAWMKKERLERKYPVLRKLAKFEKVISLFEEHNPDFSNPELQKLFFAGPTDDKIFLTADERKKKAGYRYEIFCDKLKEKHLYLVENFNSSDVEALVNEFDFSFDNTQSLFHGAANGNDKLENEILLTAKRIFDCLIQETDAIISKKEQETKNLEQHLLNHVLPQLESDCVYHENRIASKFKV